jgi:hypothetical protein
MKDNKKSIIIGAAFIVVALCITGAYMIVTWEPDDAAKPFSADFVSYDNTPTKGNELWDAMVKTGAEEIEEMTVRYLSVYYVDSPFFKGEDAVEFLEESLLRDLYFCRKEAPLPMENEQCWVYINVLGKDGKYFNLAVYSNGVVRKVENPEQTTDVTKGEHILYASSLVDYQKSIDYIINNYLKR